jgi:hypothetical protein
MALETTWAHEILSLEGPMKNISCGLTAYIAGLLLFDSYYIIALEIKWAHEILTREGLINGISFGLIA